MPSPPDELKGILSELDAFVKVNLHAAPTPKLEAPAVVIRPAPQWMAQDRFCAALERYAAVVVVSASSPEDGIAMLRLLSLAIINALPAPWDWESVEGPVIDETTGVPFLANRVNLTFKGGQES